MKQSKFGADFRELQVEKECACSRNDNRQPEPAPVPTPVPGSTGKPAEQTTWLATATAAALLSLLAAASFAF